VKSIDKLSVGEAGTVSALLSNDSMRRRFFDLGICEGARIKKISVSPMGDPSCYLVCGTMVAIRHRDASGVLIKD
jgi:Fe2+ transport system protein FeoA